MIIGLLWVFGSLLALLWMVISGICLGLEIFNEKRLRKQDDSFWSEQRRSEQARLKRLDRLRSAHFLLAIAVQILPPSERDRYLEEF